MFDLARSIDRLARKVQYSCRLSWEDARQELWVYYLEHLQGLEPRVIIARLRDRALVRPRKSASRAHPESLVSCELRRAAREVQITDLSAISDESRRATDQVENTDPSEEMSNLTRRAQETIQAIVACRGNIRDASQRLGLSEAAMYKRLSRIRGAMPKNLSETW